VAEFEVGKLSCACVGGEGGEAVPVDVGEPQLRTGCGRSFRTMSGTPAG
jgi:hypothetical protein